MTDKNPHDTTKTGSSGTQNPKQLDMGSETITISPNTPTQFRQPKNRNSKIPNKRSNLSSKKTTMLPEQSLPSTQERSGKIPTRGRPVYTQQVHKMSQFQNDQPFNRRKITTAEHMGNDPGHPGRLLACSYEEEPPQVSSIHGRRPIIFLPSPTLRTLNSSPSIHKNNEMATPDFAPTKCSSHRILGRSFDMVPQQEPNEFCDKFRYWTPEGTRIPIKLREVNNNSISTFQMAGDIVVHSFSDMEDTSRQTPFNSARSDTLIQNKEGVQERVGEPDRTNCLCMPNCQTSQDNLLPHGQSTVSRNSRKERSKKSNTSSVTDSPNTLDETIHLESSLQLEDTISNNVTLDRCLSNGLGMPDIRRQISTRAMVKSREGYKHKPPRDYGNPKSYVTPETRRRHQDLHGQRDCKVLHQPHGQPELGDQYSDIPGFNMGREKTHLPNGHENTISPEHRSRQPQSNDNPTHRMGTSPRNFSKDPSLARSPRDRPDGHSPQPQVGEIHLSVRTPTGNRDGCSNTRLEQISGNIPLPTGKSNTTDSTNPTVLQRPRSDDHTVETNGTVVPNTSNSSQRSSTLTRLRITNSPRYIALQRLRDLRSMDRVEFLKHVWTHKFDKITASNLIKSYRVSSTKQFQSVWKSFQKWLPEKIKLLKKVHVLRFLIWLHKKKGLSSKTVLSYRGALALPLRVGFNISTTDKEFNLLSRSQFLEKPAPGKKIPSWSLNHALEFFNAPRFNVKRCSLRDLFLKTLFLTAVASGNRCSELAACAREGINIKPNKVTIPVKQNFLFKNQTASHTPNAISYPALPNHSLCPVASLATYLNKTKDMPHENHLFIHPNSRKPLKSGRISYWLVQTLKMATPNFKGKAHDVRGQAFSAAWAIGTPILQILKEGFWMSPNVFINNYLCSMDSPITSFIGGRHVCRQDP